MVRYQMPICSIISIGSNTVFTVLIFEYEKYTREHTINDKIHRLLIKVIK